MDKSEIVRAEDLGMTIVEVRRRWPQAVEYTGLGGEPCWRLDELKDSIEADDAGEGDA